MAIDIAAWYEKYGPMVMRRCRKMLRNSDEALDAAQDVFVRLLDADRARRLHGAFPSSLLYTIATNVCLNRIRGARQESGDVEFIASFDRGFDHVEARLLVRAILEDESELNRAICFMYHADGMSLGEIGEAVNLSTSGVWKRLTAFRKRARLVFGQDGLG